MASITWRNTGSGDWSAAGLWAGNLVPGAGDDVVFNAGSFLATIASGETFEVHSLVQNGSTTRVGGALTLDSFSTIGADGAIDGGGSFSNPGIIQGPGTLRNNGVLEADASGGVLQISTASFTNQGVAAAGNGAVLFIYSANFTNFAGGVLSGGTYEVDGSGAAIEIVGNPSDSYDGRVVVDDATITLYGPGSAFLGYNPGAGSYSSLETTLSTITAAGTLNILGGRDYGTANSLANYGVLALAGGTLASGGLTNYGGGVIVGFGTITAPVGNGGIVEAQLGTLELAGGITNTGMLQVDAGAALAFHGTYSQNILNDGTIVADSGTLVLSGAIAGNGGYFIEGGIQAASSGPVTVLNLAATTTITGPVAFNGAGGKLVLSNPNGFTGSIVGFGAGDTIDLAGIVSNGATLVGNTLDIYNAGSIVYSLTLDGNYASASFSGNSDNAGGTLITVSGVQPRDFSLEGPSWSSKTITWSLAQYQYSQDLATSTTQGTPFSSFIDPASQAAYFAVIQQALDSWASIGGFNFVYEPDSSDFATAADLRFGWGNLLGTGGEIGQASYRSLGINFVPDTVIRLQDPSNPNSPLVANAGVIGGYVYQGFTATFYQIVMHEIGHALGLDHSTDPNAVMNPVAQGVQNQSPNASDIAGILAIYENIPCFAAGTRILTARGNMLVEELAPGDRVATVLSGRLRAVRWIGSRRVAPSRHARPDDVIPIRVAAGAFGAGRPMRDLMLSPDHAVFADGVLIPIRHLLNGATIRREPVPAVTYFHVELAEEDGSPAHDVLVAEGLPAESFLDTGNRDAFADAPAPQLHPDFARRTWDASACAPLHEGGAVVHALHARTLAIAATLGHARTDDPGLHAVADGRLIRPARRGAAWVFDLPAGPAQLRSHAAVPAEFTPQSTERRRLGVAVQRLRCNGRKIALTSKMLGPGFHRLEQEGAASWRWTDGGAWLHLAAPSRLELELGPRIAYWDSSSWRNGESVDSAAMCASLSARS